MKTRARFTVPVTRMERRVEQTQYGERVTNTSVPDGTITADVELEIAVDKILARLARGAILNKTRKATALNGLIVARATNLTPNRSN